MTPQQAEHAKRLLERVDMAGDIGPLDDGYERYWTGKGALSAFDLRVIADELDRRNKAWDEKLQRDLGGNK